MTRTLIGLLALLALLSAIQTLQELKEPTPTQHYQRMAHEYETALLTFRKAYKEAKTDQDRQRVMQEESPQPDRIAANFLELAVKYPKDPAAVDALIWVVLHIRAPKSDLQSLRSRAIQLLLRDHVQVKKMAALCEQLASAQDEDSQQLLLVVLEKSNNRPAQGRAYFALALQAEGRPCRLNTEAEALYERVAKDFADVTDWRGKKLAELAKEKLEALRHPVAK